ncbi:hypothetical protein [Pseudonocardia abyssalis]|uniref:Uncharacterized protein n=1 Tax=Pseudonocardia abyssalis TaxID=2792008 RepID=A0ABS6UZT1_9PSEU|nr:hypothetical protein [Pseudonocardia abyssalis]MBW0117438.1 hypothetical protein [Pseudonocardia abyssalis]MBW0137761.1 hypothetical protein [Pseudonocardia abyssalis]
MNGSVIGWVALVAAAWCVTALCVAITIGAMVRLRDRQVPRRDPVHDRGPVRSPCPASPDVPVAGIPSPRRAPESLPEPVELDRELRGR